MAVRIRLMRTGRKNRPCYRMAAFDSRTRRDGRCLEALGFYDPLVKDPATQLQVDAVRVRHWLQHGAIPSPKVAALLRRLDITA